MILEITEQKTDLPSDLRVNDIKLLVKKSGAYTICLPDVKTNTKVVQLSIDNESVTDFDIMIDPANTVINSIQLNNKKAQCRMENKGVAWALRSGANIHINNITT